MKTLILIFVLFVISTCLFSTIINIPADQPTIQLGIDISVDADTVLVQPGTYVENINYNGKNITVASLFLITQDTTYISQTVIDGDSLDTVVIFESSEDSTAVLCGFTIQNGYYWYGGGGISCDLDSSPNLKNIIIRDNYAVRGGGIYCDNSSPSLMYVTITDNGAEDVGGGICCFDSNPSLENVTITGNNAEYDSGGGIYCSNSSPSLVNVTITGNYAANCGGGIGCTFSSPSLVNVTITDNSAYFGGGIYCYLNSSPIFENVTITGNSTAEYGSGGGIYCNNNSSPNFENVTITGNSSIFYGSGGGIFCDNGSSPNFENVAITGNTAWFSGGGIYCKEESNPILQNVTISGNSVVHMGGGISCSNSDPSLTYVTITGNYAENEGGGIYCEEDSNPILQNLTITNNSAYNGGGIYIRDSNPILQNLTIEDNYVGADGGGIYCSNSSPNLENLTIFSNSTREYGSGGGIYFINSSPSFDAVNRCNIFLNFASSGYDLYASNCPTIDVIVDTFTVLQPDDYFAFPFEDFTFDILNAKVEQVDQDLFVSPDGSDSNSGLTVDDPLLTIFYAYVKILANSTNPHTIHLSNGIYSHSGTGERFPLNCRSYVSLLGESVTSTILDGEGTNRILRCDYDNNFSVEKITIQNGFSGILFTNSSPSLINVSISDNMSCAIRCENNSNPILKNIIISDNNDIGILCNYSSPILQYVIISNNNGNGIRCNNSNPSLENVTITGNSEDYGSGGIQCWSSSPSLVNVTISGNTANYGNGGGIECFNFSNPILVNVTITDNSATHNGGGLYCWYNSNPSLINCILWNNSPQEIYFPEYNDPNLITISYSDIQGGEAGIVTNNNGTVNWLEGNIDEDPLFVNPQIGDFHLTEDSPCIDAGDPSFPLDPDNTICDMGAFYYHQDQDIIVEEIYPEPGAITISEGDSIYFYITASDPDGNPLEYSWELDSEIVSTDSSYTFHTDENSAGTYAITINITDNYQPPSRNILNFEWDVVVEDVVSIQELLPKVTAIYQNYPNPFNPITTIKFDLSQQTEVQLDIYNIKGQKVKQLINDQMVTGQHSVIWDGKDDNNKPVSSGIYFYKLKTDSFEKTRKMILLK